ncbi:MAG: hypothetical protein CM1200mP22_06010 [Dehalococcoidia bacterium]|nr:MAG: hypothetical protein CM1200mP22_06010 [Dehalococcoidia bacterium]
MPSVVLVIDMVKGFLEPGHNLYCGMIQEVSFPKSITY